MGWRYLIALVGMIPSRHIKSNHSIVLNRSLTHRLSQFDVLLAKYIAKGIKVGAVISFVKPIV